MRIEIRPSARSTPESPLYLWRVWEDGKPVAFGITPSREEAERMAALSAADRGALRPDPAAWLDELMQES
jgi:hypothetical protein